MSVPSFEGWKSLRFCDASGSIARYFVDFNVFHVHAWFFFLHLSVVDHAGVHVYLCLCVFSSVLRLCNPIGDSSRKRIYSSPVLLHFHSDESLTHKGFYLVYRAFSPESSEHTILLCSPSVC